MNGETRLDKPVTVLKGVGESSRLVLFRMGIESCEDLVRFYPRAYEDRRLRYSIKTAPIGQKSAFLLKVVSSPSILFSKGGGRLLRFRAKDEGTTVNIVYFNQVYLKNRFHVGDTIRFFGRIGLHNGQYYLFSPSAENPEEVLADTVALYSVGTGLSQRRLSSFIDAALALYKKEIDADSLPERIRKKYHFCNIQYALENIHHPKDNESLETAKRRLVFEELYDFCTKAQRLKERRDIIYVPPMKRCDMSGFYQNIPFELTGAQKKAADEILGDLTGKTGKSKTPAMNRLLEGDVGSGKTIVAALAIFMVAKNGGKTALMAPTEILAVQHYNSLSGLFEQSGIETVLLLGSTTAAQRKQIAQKLMSGKPLLIIGTHALIEDWVQFQSLHLVITDEQHRFGVKQRDKLLAKAEYPHNLVMTATPIPRTLAMFVYAGLDISILDELPPGRVPVKTFLVNESKRERINGLIRKEVNAKRQVYIVCPLIETEENDDELLERELLGTENKITKLKSAQEYCKKLQEEVFPEFRVELLHGRQKAELKNGIMNRFYKREIDILVSTTVIEVGVNVPNATLMIIENAERFGLSQLHQLRGRIGRGECESFCILFSSSKNKETLERLHCMCRTANGFEIAQYDLMLRGPGELFGERQHGELKLNIADFAGDISLLETARLEAEADFALDK